MAMDLLGDLGPVRRTARPTRVEGRLDHCGAVLSLGVREERQSIEDVHAVPTSSGRVGSCIRAALGKERSDEVQPSQVRADSVAQLRTGQKDEARWRLEQDGGRALGESGPLPDLRGDDEPAPITHRHLIGPTHALGGPRTSMLAGEVGGPPSRAAAPDWAAHSSSNV